MLHQLNSLFTIDEYAVQWSIDHGQTKTKMYVFLTLLDFQYKADRNFMSKVSDIGIWPTDLIINMSIGHD